MIRTVKISGTRIHHWANPHWIFEDYAGSGKVCRDGEFKGRIGRSSHRILNKANRRMVKYLTKLELDEAFETE